MNPYPHRLNLARAGLALLLGAGATAFGQLGLSPDDLLARYGKPILESTNETGIQTLTFQKSGFTITAYGRAGVALRVLYQKKGLTEPDVEFLLNANRGEASWSIWTPPGVPDLENPSTLWLRSDDMAMAVRKGDELSVTAGAWNHPPAGESAPPPPPPAAALIAPAPASEPKPPPPPVRIRPGIPERLPASGDSRATAIQILGPPKGGGVSGGKEILQYDWGQVYLEHGKVMKVD